LHREVAKVATLALPLAPLLGQCGGARKKNLLKTSLSSRLCKDLMVEANRQLRIEKNGSQIWDLTFTTGYFLPTLYIGSNKTIKLSPPLTR
jgi:hypothetical protein